MSNADAGYYARRAEQELKLAQAATNPAAVAAHRRLAQAYRERAVGQDNIAMPMRRSTGCG